MKEEQAGTVISPDTKRKQRVPPNQRKVEDWPVLHAGRVHVLDPATWTFRISGLVEKERSLTYKEFMALPRARVFSDIHCVTGWSRLDNTWEGVSAATIRDLVKISPKARFVIVEGAGGFTTNLTLDDFFQADVVFATAHNGRPITADHGAPVRLVVPRLYFWKSAKWVTGIVFTEEDEPGFWESRGYHNHGDPWTEERYS